MAEFHSWLVEMITSIYIRSSYNNNEEISRPKSDKHGTNSRNNPQFILQVIYCDTFAVMLKL